MRRRKLLSTIGTVTVTLSGCNRFQNDDGTDAGPKSLIFRNSDSLPHAVRWTLRYLGHSNEETETKGTEREGKVEATATVYLEPGESRTFSDLLDERGVYAIDVAVRGSQRQFTFEYPSTVEGTPTIYGVEVNEEGNLGLINVSIDTVK